MTANIETLLDWMRGQMRDFKDRNIAFSYFQVDMILNYVDNLQDTINNLEADLASLSYDKEG